MPKKSNKKSVPKPEPISPERRAELKARVRERIATAKELARPLPGGISLRVTDQQAVVYACKQGKTVSEETALSFTAADDSGGGIEVHDRFCEDYGVKK